MKHDRNKYLTEAMGECWHEGGTRNKIGLCLKCKKILPIRKVSAFKLLTEVQRPDFSTWTGFGKLKKYISTTDHRHDLNHDKVGIRRSLTKCKDYILENLKVG